MPTAAWVKKASRVCVLFSCKHERYYHRPFPEIGEETTCYRCRSVVTIQGYVQEYNWYCTECRRARYFNTDKLNMELAATRHQLAYPGHPVQLRRGGEPYKTYEPRQPELPAGSDPPF